MKNKFILCLVLVSFVGNMALPYQVNAQVLNLPASGILVPPSKDFSAVALRGMKLNPGDPLKFNFIIDVGNDKSDEAFLKNESQKLINYFLAALTTPEDDIWVNLSPYEGDRIIPEGFGQTEMGRDLLAQDYILKQLAASLTYPETELGKKYWDEINNYNRSLSEPHPSIHPANGRDTQGAARIETTQLFTKIWIVPETAVVAETKKGAFILKSSLKVMMEEDYLAVQKNNVGANNHSPVVKDAINRVFTPNNNAFKTYILPAIEKEVNTGKNFAQLRQIYNAMILASWYKVRVKEAFLNKVYADKKKTPGIELEDKNVKYKIYNQYVEAFQKGVFDYTKVERVSFNKKTKRKYFSGGFSTDNKLGIGFAAAGTAVGLGLLVLGLGASGCSASLAQQGVDSASLRDVPVAIAPVNDFDANKADTLLKQLNIAEPDIAEHHSAFKELAGMGDQVVPFLMEAAKDDNRDTNTRKWALYLLGLTASERSLAEVSSFLNDVINDVPVPRPFSTAFVYVHIYKPWHQIEARRALDLLAKRFSKGSAANASAAGGLTSADMRGMFLFGMISRFFKNRSGRDRELKRISALVRDGHYAEAIEELTLIQQNGAWEELEYETRSQVTKLLDAARRGQGVDVPPVGGVKLDSKMLNLQRVKGEAVEVVDDTRRIVVDGNSIKGFYAIVLDVKQSSTIMAELGLS